MTAGLAGLFVAALVAATLVPAQSETVLAGMVALGDYPVALLVAVASLANTLGAVVNWGLGRWAALYRDAPWFPASRQSLDKAEGWYRRYGIWSLVASPLPFIGDPLTVAAGLMRAPLVAFVPIVAFAKTARYILIAWPVSHLAGG